MKPLTIKKIETTCFKCGKIEIEKLYVGAIEGKPFYMFKCPICKQIGVYSRKDLKLDITVEEKE